MWSLCFYFWSAGIPGTHHHACMEVCLPSASGFVQELDKGGAWTIFTCFWLRHCFPKVFRKKMIILFLCHLGLSKATFQACLLSLQPVFCKSSTLSRRHLDSPSLSLRCGDYYTFWSFRSTYPYLSGKFQRYTKVELAHVLAIQL